MARHLLNVHIVGCEKFKSQCPKIEHNDGVVFMRGGYK